MDPDKDKKTDQEQETSEGEGSKDRSTDQGPEEGQGEPDAANGENKATGKAFTQEQVNEIVTKRLEEDRKRREKEREKEEAERQGKYQKLYEEEKSERESLEPKAERADRLAERFNGQIEKTIDDWPEKIKKTDPGPEDVEARLEWVETWRETAEELKAPPEAPDTDAGKGSRPTAPKETPGEGGGQDNGRSFRFQEEGEVAW